MKEELRQYLPEVPPDGWVEAAEDQPPFNVFNVGAVYFHKEDRVVLLITKVSPLMYVSFSCIAQNASPASIDEVTSILRLFFPALKFTHFDVLQQVRDQGKELARSILGDKVDSMDLSRVKHFVAKL
jgi:hypothetical protein